MEVMAVAFAHFAAGDVASCGDGAPGCTSHVKTSSLLQNNFVRQGRGSTCKDYTKQFDEAEYKKGVAFGASDLDGDRCTFYAENKDQCGNFDDEDFIANEMCCSCDGGSTYKGARSLAVNGANVFLSQGDDCPTDFEPISTVATCRAALDLLGISGDDYNGAGSESDWPKGCYYCKGTSNCGDGVWFNSHSNGETVAGTRRLCHKNYLAADVDILFVGDSDIDYWDSSVGFPGSFNVGVGGYTTNDVIKEVDQWVEELSPTWVVLVAGENDVNGKRAVTEKAIDRFKTIANKFIANGARVIYLGTKVEPDSKELYEEYMFYDEALRAFATELSSGTEKPPFQMIDVFRSFTNTKGGVKATSWSQLYNSDGLHMSRLGYKLWNAWVKVAMGSTPCVRWADAICVESP